MKYLRVTGPDINNGLGVRCTLWIAGCGHHCPQCHNSWTWPYNQGSQLNESLDEIRTFLNKSYIKGLTVSGGDPLYQDDESLDELYDFLKHIKQEFPDKDIWIYTGYYMHELNEKQKRVLTMCDVLVDGPYDYKQRDTTLAFRGSKNQNIIYLKKHT